MNCYFVNKGSDVTTVGFVYSHMPSFIRKSLDYDLEKALSLEDRQSLVLKEVVDRNGHRVKRWCKPGTKEAPNKRVKRIKRIKNSPRHVSPSSSRRDLFGKLDKTFTGVRTALGTSIDLIYYEHLADKSIPRQLHDTNVLDSARNILENPVAYRPGVNDNGTTEYFGFVNGHEGDEKYAMVVVVMDNFEPSGAGKLHTIMTNEMWDERRQKHTYKGLNRTYKDVLNAGYERMYGIEER